MTFILFPWWVEYLFACFPVVGLCWLLVVLVSLAHHLKLGLQGLLLSWPSYSYHDIVTTPEWIPVHLHRVQIGVRIAALGLSIKGNVKMYQYKMEVVNLLTKVRWEIWLNLAEQGCQKKRYLIAGATVIVPDREFRDRFWHLENKVWDVREACGFKNRWFFGKFPNGLWHKFHSIKRSFKFQAQCPGFVVPLAMFTKGYLHACIVNYVSNNFSFWEIVPCQSSVWPKIMTEIVLEVNNLQDLLKWHKMWWYNPDITDVTLASDDQSIKAHKVILSACSP